MTTKAISFNKVSKHFSNVYALNELSFSIEEGGFFGLLGPNGAGKSTLINVTSGLARPTSGSVNIFGKDVIKDFRDTRRMVGVVPQELISDGFFCVRDMLRLQAGYFGFGKEQYDWIEELIDTMALTAKAEELTQTLSGGMKRRTLIAMALVHRPKIVILDEPTAGVDVNLRQTLWKFIRKLHLMGHTIILTTHYLEEAEQLCDRIAILDQGNLVTLEDKSTLLNDSSRRLEQVYLDIIKQSRDQEEE